MECEELAPALDRRQQSKIVGSTQRPNAYERVGKPGVLQSLGAFDGCCGAPIKLRQERHGYS